MSVAYRLPTRSPRRTGPGGGETAFGFDGTFLDWSGCDQRRGRDEDGGEDGGNVHVARCERCWMELGKRGEGWASW